MNLVLNCDSATSELGGFKQVTSPVSTSVSVSGKWELCWYVLAEAGVRMGGDRACRMHSTVLAHTASKRSINVRLMFFSMSERGAESHLSHTTVLCQLVTANMELTGQTHSDEGADTEQEHHKGR